MLDTDSVSFALRGVGHVGARILEHNPSELCVSALTVAELRFGADRKKSGRLHGLIDAFLRPISVLPFDEAGGNAFGKVASALVARGRPIGSIDTLIAAHALAVDCALVTNNEKHFRNVADLRVENWV